MAKVGTRLGLVSLVCGLTAAVLLTKIYAATLLLEGARSFEFIEFIIHVLRIVLGGSLLLISLVTAIMGLAQKTPGKGAAIAGLIVSISVFSLLATNHLVIPLNAVATLKMRQTQKMVVKAMKNYFEDGRFAEAELLIKRALAIQVEALGPEHAMTASTLVDMGYMYSLQDRYAEAESLMQRALAIQEKAPDPDHVEIAFTLGGLATVCLSQGRDADAEPLLQRALAIQEKALGPDHSGTSISIHVLAQLYANQGRFAEAEPLLQRAVAIKEKACGWDHLRTAPPLSDLADLYAKQGRYAEAERLFQRVLAIQEKAYGPNQLGGIGTLNGLATLYVYQGRYAEAESLYKRALHEKTFGPEHTMTAWNLNGLALTCWAQGRDAEAESLFQRSLAIFERVVPGHSQTAITLNHLTWLYFSTTDKRALQYARRAFDAESAIIAESFSMLSEDQRMGFVDYRGNAPLLIAMSLALPPNSDFEATCDAWLMLLRSKGQVLDAMLEDRQRLAGDPAAEPLFARLAETKSRLAKLQFRDLADLDAKGLTQQRDQLDSLRGEQDEMERQLARLSGRFREGRRASTVTAEAVGQALPEDSALIEFLRFAPLIPATSWADPAEPEEMPPQYVAFVLARPEQPPKLILLGGAERIDDLIATAREGMQEGAHVDETLCDLHRLIWAPLSAAVGDRKRVLISPDGDLNFLSFASLQGPDGKYLIEKYDIGYIASGRDLVRQFNTDGTATNSPALFGDPDFGAGDPAPPLEPKSLTRASTFLRVLSDADRSAATGLRLARLPASSNEIIELSRLMEGQNPQTYLEAAATEEHLKSSVRPDILHLATHGFFLPEPERPEMNLSPAMRMMDRFAPSGPGYLGNPMHRSGLALAGAQLALDGQIDQTGNREDGIVTAEEVGGLDLWGTRLVVLSACQTGVGEVLSGEGVMGLRRAFVQAGAWNLLLTLWNVEDETTRDLMLVFYRDYLKTNDAIGAMSRAQRATLSILASNPHKNHPRFWAPYFVSVQGHNDK